MKKKLGKIKKNIMKNKENALIISVSIIGLVIGTVAFNFWLALLIIGTLDILLFIPPIFKKRKKGSRSKKGQPTNKLSSSKKSSPKKKLSSKDKKRKILKYGLIAFFTLTIIIIIFAMIFFYVVVKNAEFNPEKLYTSEASIIYDKDGNIITKIGNEMRVKLTIDEMPEVLIDAIIATEDSRFFQHNGFDLPRFLKASFGQVLGQDAGGASTLTMQIAKNYLTSTESKGMEGIIRKFTDIYLSIFKIEKQYTKFEILEFYANSNYLGGIDYGGAYGVEQASQLYFNKKAKDMTLPEAALIAGLFQAPNGYDPYLYPDEAEGRRKTVLYLMERHGYITSEERKIAEKTTVSDLIVEREAVDGGEYVGLINTVVAEVMRLTDNIDPFVTSMEIYTTFDLEKQDHINKVFNETYTWENDVVDAGVSVLDVNTGEILAIGAGRHKKNLKGYNLATDIENHIGSTAKPLYDYGPGIEFNNWSTYHPFADEPHTYSTGISIHNWDFKHVGITTLRESLRTSKNIPALKAFQNISNKDIKNFVTSIGLHPELEDELIHESHALGGYTGESPVSLAGAYATFANGGYYNEPHSVKKIVFRDSNEVLENKIKKEKVMSPSTAYMITDVLRDAAYWSLYGTYSANGVTYAAKTGTSNFPDQAFKEHNLPSNAVNDLWIAAYNPDYVITQWYGYDEISNKYHNKFGKTDYRYLFQAILKGIFKENKKFTKPNDVLSIAVEKGTVPAMLPSEFTPKDMILTELFKKGTEPTEVSTRYSRLENPSNLQVKQEDSNINITWDPIDTPSSIDKEELKKFFQKVFKNKKEQDKYLNEQISYNKKNIGELGYNVYIKNGDNLQLLGFTKNNSFTTSATSGTATYIVKSSYSIFKTNMSTGIETTIVPIIDQEPLITSDLIDPSDINCAIGSVCVETNPGVTVNEDMEIVTSLAEITKTITEESTGIIVDTIDTVEANTYIITYNIKYKSYNKTHTRKVIIE
ncbi:MAG: transglycosylase domain-containing protein [Bacilli bacterium]|nr:transglycosylase domain-containing protein [Bacilli bacterium]MDD4282725.1 transglycosylase domain-containing protein [Bacilli bacterium]MDD4718393.1 transglycosylase domain-containing protein [Bacilli bacterium]